MSLLSPDRLTLVLAPDTVQAVHTRGWRARLVSLESSPWAAVEAGDWSACLAACADFMGKWAPRSVRVVLSDRLVRYLPMAWHADIQGTQEELALARIEFEETYGDNSAADWCLSISNEKPGMDRLLCAMPLPLLEGLRRLCASKKVRLTSVQPSLIAVIHGLRKQLGPQGWFVHPEGARLTMLHWNQAGCHWVATGRCETGNMDSAITALHREMLISGAAEPSAETQTPVYLANATQRLSNTLQAHELRVTVLGQPASTLAILRGNASLQLTEESALLHFGSALLGAGL